MSANVSPIYAEKFQRATDGSVGQVWLVGAGPGAADLITLRAERLLSTADVILYDSLVDGALLEGRRAAKIYVGKRCGRHSMTQNEICDLLVQCAMAGKNVVRLKGGDPSVFGRVGEEALALAAKGIHFDIVPGVSSSVAAPCMAGIPLTHRGVADGFVVVTAHKRRENLLPGIPVFRHETTLVLMMPLSTIATWQPQLLSLGYPASLPLAFVVNGCGERARVVESTVACALEDVLDPAIESPCLVVVGHVVQLRKELFGWMGEQASSRLLQNGTGQACQT